MRAALDLLGMDDLIDALAGRGRRRVRRVRRPSRSFDPDLDELEVDDVEQAVAGRTDDDDADDTADEWEVAEGANGRAGTRRTSRRAGEDDEEEWETESVDDDEEDEEEDEVVDEVTPEALEAEVLAAFRADPVLRRRALEIAVDEEGVLTLTGWVRRERELRLARRVARRVDGIAAVRVDVAVRDLGTSDAAAGPASVDVTEASEDQATP